MNEENFYDFLSKIQVDQNNVNLNIICFFKIFFFLGKEYSS